MNINEVHWNFQIMEPRNLLKPYFETSVILERFGFFDAVFTVVLRRMSSITYVCDFICNGVSLCIGKLAILKTAAIRPYLLTDRNHFWVAISRH